MIVVPDASVILKWVLEREEGEDMPQAFRLQEAFLADQIELRLPSLWRYEVGNVLGLKKPEMSHVLMNNLLRYEFEEVRLDTAYCLAVLEHMQEIKGVTFYDSTYHVLALQTKGLYVTADVEYLKRAKRKGHMTLLAEWKTR